MSNFNSLLFTLIIGLSTIIGNLILFVIKKRSNKIIGVSLAISAGVMIYLILFDMIPEVIGEETSILKIIIASICVLLGYLFSKVVDKLIPHHHENETEDSKEESNHLMHIGIITVLSIVMHNLLEGIAIYTTSVIDVSMGISLGIGTIMHNIPLGFMVATVFYFMRNKKLDAFKYTLLIALSTFIGGILGYFIINSIGNIENILGYIIAAIVGTIVYIIANELIPTAIKYCKIKMGIFIIIISMVVMYIVECIM